MLRSAARSFLLASLTISLAEAGAFAAQSAPQAQPSSQPSTPSTKAKAPAQSQAASSLSTKPQPNQKTFASPQEAASALYSAARGNDENSLLVILGPSAREIIVWTDNAEDRKAETGQFVKKYDQMHRLVKEPDGETTLYVGAENWPLPIPLIESHGAWYFDAALGKQEILYRRIGENEVETIDALQAIVDAEKEYYAQDPPRDGSHEYAAHFDSAQGSRNGLYWSSTNNDSPLGPYMARASYDRSDRMPMHGYFFRMLMAQGPSAPGGAKSYLANGKMTGGFAILAFPAEYRVSGVKTFIVNQNGVVYERDLGAMTTQIASAMKDYNPTAAWRKVQ
jgi:hypothetical protein